MSQGPEAGAEAAVAPIPQVSPDPPSLIFGSSLAWGAALTPGDGECQLTLSAPRVCLLGVLALIIRWGALGLELAVSVVGDGGAGGPVCWRSMGTGWGCHIHLPALFRGTPGS